MALPRVQPIAPTWRKAPFDHPEWLFDVKYDGFRAVCYIQRGRCNLVSRRGNVFTRFDALGEQVASTLCDQGAELDVDEAILDGEVITADETGRPQFYDLLRRRRGPAYVAFDVLWMTYYGKTLSKKLSYGTKVTSYGIGRSVRLGKPRAP